MKSIDKYFEPFPGLNLIENPKCSRKRKQWFESPSPPKINFSPREFKYQSHFDNYQTLIQQQLRDIKESIDNKENKKKSNFYKHLLDSGFHYYISQLNREELVKNTVNEVMEYILCSLES